MADQMSPLRIKRLLQYSQLLMKGASEAERIVLQCLNKKKTVVRNLKYGKVDFQKARDELNKILSEETVVADRVIKWIRSSESKIAVKQLKQIASVTEKELGINAQVNKVLYMSNEDEKLVMRLMYNIKAQQNLVGMEKLGPQRMAASMEKNIALEERFIRDISVRFKQGSANVFVIKQQVMAGLRRAAAKAAVITGVSAATLLASATNASAIPLTIQKAVLVAGTNAGSAGAAGGSELMVSLLVGGTFVAMALAALLLYRSLKSTLDEQARQGMLRNSSPEKK